MKKRASDMGDDGKPIDVLREVADRLRTGDDIERRFALGLDAYLEHAAAGMTLGAALGLKPAWWLDDARRCRNATLGDFARMYCGGDVDTLRREVNRYRETWQRRDQGLSAMPAAYAGTPRELLYRAFRENKSARARMPTSARQFQRIVTSVYGATKISDNPPRGPFVADVVFPSRVETERS